MRFEDMKPDEYRAARDAAPIAYIPWGSHEWHCKQNPLGVDSLKSHGMCLALCAETGGVVFPPVYCGHQSMKPYAGFDCTLEFSRECVVLLVTEYLRQLSDEGFKVVIILMGHHGPLHQEAIREAAAEFNEAQNKTVAWAAPDSEFTSKDGFQSDHGARFETSYMMFLRPELVDLTRLPDRELTLEDDGIMGQDPRGIASAKTGRDGINSLVKNAAPMVLELLRKVMARG